MGIFWEVSSEPNISHACVSAIAMIPTMVSPCMLCDIMHGDALFKAGLVKSQIAACHGKSLLRIRKGMRLC
jgi:hypothetical protein